MLPHTIEAMPQSGPIAGRRAGIPSAPNLEIVELSPSLATAPFVISPVSDAFRLRHFPDSSREEWNDWRWQLRHRFRTVSAMERVLRLSDEERQSLARNGDLLPTAITPYYASLLSEDDPNQPLRRTLVPVLQEFVQAPGEADDPLGEDSHSPVPGLVHRYPDRVLFLALDHCAVYCRYCTRSRMVGTGEMSAQNTRWEAALHYIEEHPEIRDVLISGGDPLTMSDDRLSYLLGRLRSIEHVEFLRIGTKVPVVLPQRITPDLVAMLRQYHPLWMSIHFMHPEELTPEVSESCQRLADAGIPLGSQTVLCRGVNDEVPVLKKLYHGLLKIRVRPYYLYQCDPISGSAHFRTPVSTGLKLIQGLRGHTSGYAVPQFVIDAPGGGGKIPLLPESVVGRDGDDLVLRNFEGKLFRYPDPTQD